MRTHEKMEQKTIKEVHILLHPIRFRIVELLKQKPIYINEISKVLGEERRLVSYHLHTLEEYGFVSSKYEISEHPKLRGKAIRKYWLTGKDEEVMKQLKRLI